MVSSEQPPPRRVWRRRLLIAALVACVGFVCLRPSGKPRAELKIPGATRDAADSRPIVALDWHPLVGWSYVESAGEVGETRRWVGGSGNVVELGPDSHDAAMSGELTVLSDASDRVVVLYGDRCILNPTGTDPSIVRLAAPPDQPAVNAHRRDVVWQDGTLRVLAYDNRNSALFLWTYDDILSSSKDVVRATRGKKIAGYQHDSSLTDGSATWAFLGQRQRPASGGGSYQQLILGDGRRLRLPFENRDSTEPRAFPGQLDRFHLDESAGRLLLLGRLWHPSQHMFLSRCTIDESGVQLDCEPIVLPVGLSRIQLVDLSADSNYALVYGAKVVRDLTGISELWNGQPVVKSTKHGIALIDVSQWRVVATAEFSDTGSRSIERPFRSMRFGESDEGETVVKFVTDRGCLFTVDRDAWIAASANTER